MRRSAPLLGDEVADRRARPTTSVPPRAPPTSRFLDKPAGAQIGERVVVREARQPRDAATAHRHDDLAALGDVIDVTAELIVQLTDADLALDLPTI
jgi:hypothetical protein